MGSFGTKEDQEENAEGNVLEEAQEEEVDVENVSNKTKEDEELAKSQGSQDSDK